ncbi:sugar ABC transporter permease [Paenibacillus faecis]|uniref:Sugar ABC transporter permease n=2 Tax=Paenibacillus TaxID=44249 RepID=A0A5D0CPI9_9BACL|nr:sugar ABC transporter permease [Paenibacillus faecis]
MNPRPRGGYNARRRTSQTGWLFVLIPVLMISIFYFYPMVQAFILSLKSGRGSNLSFVGADNYIRLFSDANFITAVKNTFIYLIVQVPIMLVLAIFIAVLLNDDRLKFKGFFRTAIFLPTVTSLVAYSVVFKYMFGPDGIVNKFLLNLHLIQDPIQWITDPFWAKVTIIIAITWRFTGYNMIFYLSSLQNIDKSVYEAARIDGAGAITQFFKITIPLLKPIILFTTITSTIGTLQLFDEVVNITKGGPGNATMSISQYIYNLSFEYTPDFGYAATVSYSIVLMVVILTMLQNKIGGDKR